MADKSTMAKTIPDQSALGLALLIYMCIMVAVMTLIPFEFQLPVEFRIHWSTNFSDVVTNIFLFVPVGFLLRLARFRHRDPFCLHALLLGVLLSLAIETAQAFVPTRYTQAIDVLTNGFGAWLGGVAYALFTSRVKEVRAGRLLTPELPLVGLIYLVTPLMWLNGLANGRDEARLWLLVPLGIVGSVIIGAVYVHRFKHDGDVGYTKLSAFTMGWFGLSSLPALFFFPAKVACFMAAALVVVLAIARLGNAGSTSEKRFEIPTIKKILPVYLIYLLLIEFWPAALPAGEWPFADAYRELAFQERISVTFRFIELIAAFTLLGYMIAEIRGRKDETADKTLGWTFGISAITSILIETLKAYPVISSINLYAVGYVIAACIYGAVIYRLQLAAIERQTGHSYRGGLMPSAR